MPVIFGVDTLIARRTAWRMKIEVAASRASGGRMMCVTPRLPGHVAQFSLEISLNGQQFTADGTRFDITRREDESPIQVPQDGRGFFGDQAVLLAFMPSDPSRNESSYVVLGPD